INPMVYALLQSHISDHISFKATQEVREQLAQDPQMMQLAQTDPQSYQIAFDKAVATATAEITAELVRQEMSSNNQEDPLVRIKQQEIDIKAMDMQRKEKEMMFRQENENQRANQKLQFEYDRLQQQDEASDKRLQIAAEKLNIQRRG
ncbi:MAG: hypothetical protein ACO3HJ_07955, partial [Methylophilaceae bacterium]